MDVKILLEAKDFFLEGKDKLFISPFDQNDMVSHTHHFFEFVYVTGGTAVQNMNGSSQNLEKGDYFIVDYGSVHSYSSSRNFTLINCLFLPEIIDDTLRGCRSFEELLRHCLIRYYSPLYRQTPVNRIFKDTGGAVLEIFKRMLSEHSMKQPGYQELLRCQLIELMVRLSRIVVDAGNSGAKSRIVIEIINYVNENYHTQLSLGEFCAEKHFNMQYISRKFKKETGLTYKEYLQQTRIRKSCELLAGTDIPVEEICHKVGYRDVKFFASVFKHLTGMAPMEYRRQFS